LLLQTFTLKIENKALKTGGKALPPMRAEIHRDSMAQKPQRLATCGGAGGGNDVIRQHKADAFFMRSHVRILTDGYQWSGMCVFIAKESAEDSG
jgi:hypothetical protein